MALRMKLPHAVSFPFPLFLAALASAHAAPGQAVRDAALSEFTNTCARCHNADGSGYADLGIPNFTDPVWQAAHPEAERELTIRNGVTGKMPAFGAILSAGEIEVLLEHVRGFKGDKPRGQEPAPLPIEPRLAPPGHGAGPVVLGRVGVYTQHNDNARLGANLHEAVLTPASVNPRPLLKVVVTSPAPCPTGS